MKSFTFSKAWLAGLLSAASLSSQALVINYNGFASTAGLTMVGDTAAVSTGGADGTVLRVTRAAESQSGAAYSTSAVTLGTHAVFSTTFQFRFTGAGGIAPADGITFVLAANNSGLGLSGGGIGIQGLSNSVAIEFDNYNNFDASFDSNSSNHVALDINGTFTNANLSNVYGVQTCDFGNGYAQAGCMANGHLWTATIGYDGNTLTASLIDPAMSGSFLALSVANLDIGGILGTNTAYVGFTSATGLGFMNHDIVNWSFANDLRLVEPGNNVPEPGSLALLGLALGSAGLARRRRA